MRFLVDECTGPKVSHWLKEEGFEVFSVFEEARGASDQYLIEKAYSEGWVVITNDKDFGEKVFRQKHPHRGIILLRLENERWQNKIRVLQQLLSNHPNRIPNHFIVLTDTHVRFSKP